MRKTYGVKGMMEFKMALRTSNPHRERHYIHFTGGQITGYGVAPARYSTEDEAEQRLIEGSPDFYDPSNPKRDPKTGDIIVGRVFLMK